ncbi:hypothetical protein A3A70_00445 [candidate division WWE3 bacterium RIFCSPLOWO2_01_FULL_42_11]|uniref:Thioredoxin domain-containing protein n=1 Tax=candidate division WWE3 bacterium RIFCSPLOWO2_01_FULL_42_11 TaxID=1802627 RepID=A0A1F4VLS2_UNCKA|nr:MAG: hypothetical protein A3A70_00445 [candidate division WWE3 bacterium RIFCSPLOWO2_01_FULL_42_11]
MNEVSRKSILIWGLGIGGMLLLILGGAMLATRSTSQKVLGDTQASLAVAVTAEDWSKGPADASVTLVEYSDFQCPACKNAEPLVKALIEQNPDVKFVYRHFPIHDQSLDAGKAAEAAGAQGKFWEMHDVLFDKQNDWAGKNDAKDKFTQYAKDLGLNMDQFKKDFDDSKSSDSVALDQSGGDQSGVNATPTFFINGKIVKNANNLKDFQALIDASK